VLRREIGFIAVLFGIAVTVAGVSLYSSHVEAVRRDNEAALKARNLGRFTLSLEPFDWDPAAQRAIAVDAAPLGLAWQLLKWTDDGPGQPLAEHDDVERGASRFESGALVEDVEARGGRAFLWIQRRGCAPSLLPLKELPGYAERELPRPVFRISVPSCAATRAGMIEIPAGTFILDGAGVPPASGLADYPELQIEHRITLPRFWIDRTEVTNAAFGVFARMAAQTGIAAGGPAAGLLAMAGGLRFRVGDHNGALELLREAVVVARDMGARPQLSAALDWSLGPLVKIGRPEPAATLFGALTRGALADVGNFPLVAGVRARTLERVRVELGEDSTDRLVAEGAAMTYDEIIDYALRHLEPT
jgi:hypothetical protein